MTGERKGWTSVALVAAPLVIIIGLAGVLVVPGIDEAASLDTRLRALDGIEREADRVGRLVRQFDEGGKARVLALEAWRKKRIPAAEDDRARFDRLRRIETRCGVKIVRCTQSARRPWGGEDELLRQQQLMIDEDDEGGAAPPLLPGGFDVVSMKVVVRGTFLRLVSFTEELQFGDRLFAFRAVRLARKEAPVLELTLELDAVLERTGSRRGSERNP